jgi:hypothetical protein
MVYNTTQPPHPHPQPIPTMSECISSLYKFCGDTNAAKSVNRSILKKSRHIGLGVFIVFSSMIEILLLTGKHTTGGQRVETKTKTKILFIFFRESMISFAKLRAKYSILFGQFSTGTKFCNIS